MEKVDDGFTLLEVMVAIALIAISLTAVLGSQSQSVSLAGEARFNTTAALLAQSKMAEMESQDPEDLTADSGDFGEDFPGYTWTLALSNVILDRPENVSDHLKRVDLTIAWGEDEQFLYTLRVYLFFQKTP
jgi:general secretion pathway protein I